MTRWNVRSNAKRRGSVLVYTSILMVAITTVVIGTVQLNLVASQKAERRVDDAEADATFQAQVALVTSVCKDNSITLPMTFTTTLNGQNLTCDVTDNDSSLAHSYRIASTGSGGLQRSYSQVVGGRQASHPFYFALWTGDDLNATGTGVSTTTGGSVYSEKKMTLDSASSISGDALCKGTMTPGTASVSKNCMGNDADLAFYNANYGDLKAEATSLLSVPSLASLSFLALLVNGHYALHYYDTATSLSGTVSGKGTAVFDKNITVTGNIAYLAGSARVVYLVRGDVTINPGVNRVDGMWYIDGKLNATGTTASLNNMRGAFVVKGTITTTRPINIAYDSAFWSGRPEGQRHCVPGFWPTAAAGLMR